MGKSVSSDLRLRIVRGVAAGETRRATAARLEVAPSTAVRIQARYARTGSVEPARQGRPAGSGKLGPHRLAIVEKVKAKPDITEFEPWLKTNFEWSLSTARNQMNAAKLADENPNFVNLQPAAAAKMVASKTPDSVKQKVFAELDKGNAPTSQEIEALISEKRIQTKMSRIKAV